LPVTDNDASLEPSHSEQRLTGPDDDERSIDQQPLQQKRPDLGATIW
jgi:hypothetical protein